MASLPDMLATFDYHGCDINEQDLEKKQVPASCPLCLGSKRRFFINPKTSQWDCKLCGAKGNLQTFLEQLLEKCLGETTDDHYKELADHRAGIPWGLFKEHQFAWDGNTDRWLIPSLHRRGHVIGINTWHPGQAVMGTAGLPQTMWRQHKLRGQQPVIITEGVWDCLSLEHLRRKAAIRGMNVVSVPGCNVFKLDWRDHFHGREVILYYDNQGQAEAGAERAAAILRTYASSISILRWPADFEEGIDIRDYVHKYYHEEDYDPKDLWRELRECCEVVTQSSNSDTTIVTAPEDQYTVKRSSFRTVVQDFRKGGPNTKGIELTKQMVDGLALIYATTLSVFMHGDPIWLFVVGPPGCGKTLLLKSMSKVPYCIFKSSLTPKSLVSGYCQNDGADPSLLAHMKGRVLILKDYTEIISMAAEMREEMYATLRGAFDGFVEKSFGNGITRKYEDTWFPYIAGVTDVIHGDDRAALGERFLKYQFCEGYGYDPNDHIQAALSGIKEKAEMEEHFANVSGAFMSHFGDQPKFPDLPAWTRNRIVALAQIVGQLRMTVPIIGRNQQLLFRPVPEVGTRVAIQLAKLAQSLAVVLNKSKIDQQVYSIVERVGMDTARGWNMDIAVALANSKHPIERDPLSDVTNINAGTLNNALGNMRLAKVVTRERIPQKGAGQPPYGYTLSPHLKKLWKQASIGRKK